MRLASGGAASSPVLRLPGALRPCPFLGGVSFAACNSADPASPIHTCAAQALPHVHHPEDIQQFQGTWLLHHCIEVVTTAGVRGTCIMLGRAMRPFEFGMWALAGLLGWQWRTNCLGQMRLKCVPLGLLKVQVHILAPAGAEQAVDMHAFRRNRTLMVGACLGQVWLGGVPLGLLWVQVQGLAPAGARQAVLIGWLPPEPAVQRTLPLPARRVHVAWCTGLHIQLPHRMPDLSVQLLHGADGGSCTAPQAPHSPAVPLHEH